MRLAEAGRAADEERVVGEAGHLGDRERRGVGEAVRVADDELLEGVAGVEAPRRVGGVRRARPPSARHGGAIAPRGAVVCAVVVPGRDELDRGPAAEDGAGAALEQVAEALLDPGPDPSGATTTRVPSSRRWPVSGSSHWCQVDSGTARWSSARIRRQQDGARRRSRVVERPPRAEARCRKGSGGGPTGPGAANIARGPRPVRGLSQIARKRSAGWLPGRLPRTPTEAVVPDALSCPSGAAHDLPGVRARRPGATGRAATVRPDGRGRRAQSAPRTRCPRSRSRSVDSCARAVHSVWMDPPPPPAACARRGDRGGARAAGRAAAGAP